MHIVLLLFSIFERKNGIIQLTTISSFVDFQIQQLVIKRKKYHVYTHSVKDNKQFLFYFYFTFDM